MLMSRSRKFVFIEVPKTGTSAIGSRLVEIDPELERNILYLPDGARERVSTHITAAEMRHRLGREADDYCFIGFLRDPVDQLISKYFFYKSGRVKQKVFSGSATPKRVVRHIIARLLPLNLWILIYPYKGAAHFVLDRKGQLCVDIIGNFHALETHFREVFARFGYPIDQLMLQKVNVSDYSHDRGKLFQVMSGLSLGLHARQDVDLFATLPRDGGPYLRRSLVSEKSRR